MTKKPPITKSKTKWVKQFKPNYIEGEPLRPNASIEKRTIKRSEALASRMIKETERELNKLFKKESPAYFAQDASIASQARILISMLTKKYSKMFDIDGTKIMDTMVSDVDRYSKTTVKNSVKKLSGGIVIDVKDLSAETKENIKASASQAASYIKSIQSDYLDKVAGFTYRSITSGEGLKDLIPNIQKLSGQTKRKAKNIALDQTRKTTASLNQARLKQNGITKAVWKHSASGLDPRKTHQAMNGKVFEISEGLYDPDVGRKIMPTELPYCRCYMTPIITFDEVEVS